MNSRGIPTRAAVLGYSGLVPFAVAAALAALGDARTSQVAVDGFLVYGAVILSFLGGIRWGAASTNGNGRGLVFAVIPSLWAAFTLWWFTPALAAWVMVIGFAAMGVADRLYPGRGVPAWMSPLRTRLSIVVVACHLLVVNVI